ncbi:MAG: tetratricopeptide repeat protein [Bacteroidota bacterium]
MIKQLFEGLSKEKTLAFFLLLIAVVIFVYSNHFNNAFHFDDSHAIENNLFIQDVKNIPLFFKDATTFSSLPSNQSYRPIVSTSLAIDYWLGKGYNLFYFHLSSFIIFLLQGILMFFFIFKFFNISYKNSWNFYIAAAAVAWYLLHPANAETINYIIARSDLQSTFFIILGFVLYMYSPYCKAKYLYLIPVGIGGLAKPTTVMFAPMLFFYILLFEQNMSLYQIFDKKYTKQLIDVIKKTIPSFIFCVVLYFFIESFTPATWESGGRSMFSYLITQPFVIVHYFTTFFFPFGLSADTDWEPLQNIWDIRFFIGSAFILLLVFIAFLFSKDKRLRPVSYGILWFFLALVPSSSVIPFAEVLNDHRIFFPYVGLVLSVCWTIGLLILKYKKHFTDLPVKYEIIAATAVLVCLSGYAFGTHERNKVWNTEESLWRDVTIKSPKNARGLMNYGLSRMGKGDYVEAEKCFTKAIAMWPYYYSLHINMGVLKNATGDKVSAEQYFKSATEFSPNSPDPWFFYGNFLSQQLRYTEAIPMLAKCVELSPASIGARSVLMKAYNDTGEWDKLNTIAQGTLQIMPNNNEAMEYLKASQNRKGKIEMAAEEVKKAPTAQKYFDLGLMYYSAGKYEQCVEAYLEAVKLKPNYDDAYNNMGSAYTLMKQFDKGIAACQKAIEINPDFQLAKNNLADAINQRDKATQTETIANSTDPTAQSQLDLSLSYYQGGQYEKSIEACKKAIELKPDYADAYSNMGAAYNQLKQWDKAIEACNKALKINPEHKLAKGNLNWAKDEKAKSKK